MYDFAGSPAKSYIPKSLDSCPFVFVRVDSLTTPYNGPFRVIRKESKHFRIEIQGREETVCIERLKPACIDCEDKAVITTGAGRTSKRPVRFVPSGTQGGASVATPIGDWRALTPLSTTD